MSKALEELKEIFSQSSLSLEDQNDLLVFLPILPEKVLNTLAKTFKEDPEAIEEFYANFKAKFNALNGESDRTWDEIIEEEARMSGELPEEDFKDEIEQFEEE